MSKSSVFKFRPVTTVVVGTGAFLAWMFVYFWPEWGGANSLLPGSDGSESGSVSQAEEKEKPSTEEPPPSESEKHPNLNQDQVIQVRIDGRTFLVLQEKDGGAEYVPATLDEIEKLISTAKGDGDGIRVRVSRRGNSRPTAENSLRAKLQEMKLKEDEIRWQEGLVE